MTERPILFSGPMVRAILEGRKTQTRRVIKPAKCKESGVSLSPCEIAGEINQGRRFDYSPYGGPGDRLWVRETWGFVNPYGYATGPSCLSWRACGRQRIVPVADVLKLPDSQKPHTGYSLDDKPCWRPSIHMPRWACRLVLEVARVRVERLAEISGDDAAAEGCDGVCCARPCDDYGEMECPGIAIHRRAAFARLWDQINGTGSWDLNPWVWAVEFRVCDEESQRGGCGE